MKLNKAFKNEFGKQKLLNYYNNYLLEELKKLSLPVFLYVGEKDIILNSLETANRLKTILPQSVITIIPNVGHSIINMTENISKQIK